MYFYYMIEAILFPIAVVITVILNVELWKFLLVMFMAHELLVIMPALFRGWRVRLFWKALTSVPAYYLTRPVNIAAWYVSLVQEWILNNKLVTWKKGH